MYISTYATSTCTLVVCLARLVAEVYHLVLQYREVSVHIVCEVLNAVFPSNLELISPVLHPSEVAHWRALADIGRHWHVSEHVLSLLVEVVEAKAQTTVEETEVNTEVYLLRGLPFHVGIGNAAWRRTVNHRTGIGTCLSCHVGNIASAEVIVLTAVHQRGVEEVADRGITVLTP